MHRACGAIRPSLEDGYARICHFRLSFRQFGWNPTLFKSLISILVVIRVELNIGHVPHFSPTTRHFRRLHNLCHFSQTTRPCVKLLAPSSVPTLFSFSGQKLTGTLDGAKPEGLIRSDPRFYFENLACPAVIKG
jgi:hypothetical protein